MAVVLHPFFTFFNVQATPLPASQVFQVQVRAVDPNTFIINWKIKEHYFLYSDRITLDAEEHSNVHLGTLLFPPTLNKTDKQGRIHTIYRNELSLPVSILGTVPGEALLLVHFQGCADDGFCYPPETRTIKLSIDKHLALADVSLETATKDSEPSTLQQDDEITRVFTSHHWPMIILIFYGFGLLLSFTPCILPMVPVLSGIIVGHSEALTTRKAFLLSLSYVLSMSLTYAIIGGIVAKLGANLQISMQSPWAISLFSLLFIALALSMFGFYEFKLPHSWQNKIAGTSRNQRGGHYLGAAVMGCLSTLILSPCVTAPLIGVLSYIAQTGHVLAGSMVLFFLSLGMGTPLLLIGSSAAKWLPATGSWMNAVKAFFGILFLAIAIYLMARILPSGIVMVLWACLLIFSGIYSGALNHALSHQEKFWQGIGIILLGYGLLILIGASMGSTNPLQPLSSLQAAKALPPPVTQQLSLNQVKQMIEENKGRPIMLDFYADWCVACKVMDASTFKNPTVQRALGDFKIIKIDLTRYNAEDKALMNYFKIIAPPTFIFFNAKGKQLESLRVVGERSAEEFLSILKAV